MRCVCLGHFLWMPCNLTSQSEQTSCRLEGWHVCPRFSSIAWYPALGTSSTCSRAVHRVLIFPRLEPVPRFPALAINRPRSIYQYSNMTPRLSGQTSIFGVSLYLSLFWELRDKGNLKNLQFWPESLGAMLEYWYIERGLLQILPTQGQYSSTKVTKFPPRPGSIIWKDSQIVM